MMKQVILLFCLTFALTLSVSESKPTSVQPHAVESFSAGNIQMLTADNCSYLVIISTSCLSPKFTSDNISIAFGDAHGNEVYEERLNDPISKKFEQCSSDTFQIDGECASPICYVYLHRSGHTKDDYSWQPESVKIFGYNADPVTFNFNSSIPNDTWYGYNLCDIPSPPPPSPPYILPPPPPPPSSPSSSYQLFPHKCLICVIIGFVLSYWM